MIAPKNIHRAAKTLGACCMLLALAAFSCAAEAQVGYVHEVSGKVSIHSLSHKSRPAMAGDTFETDTVFRTGTYGNVILKFADGQVVALGTDSALRVGQYRYVARDLRQSASTVELMNGEMRFLAGLIGAANREGVRIIAGYSVIGIQKPGGADFTVAVNTDARELGYAVVALGEISVRTPYGPVYRIASGQYVPWRPGRTSPLPVPVAAAPAVVQAAAAGLWATVLPTDTPVAVATAAHTALVTAAPTVPTAPTAAATEVGPAIAAASAEPMQAGYVDSVSSAVVMQRASGTAVTAHAGDMFQSRTTFDTGTDGRVVLKFADGQVVALGPGSLLGVDQYQFDPCNPKANRSAVQLIDGAMRYVTGVLHADNREGITIAAGASLVDIVSPGVADFTVLVDTKEHKAGVAAVRIGEISVNTPHGPVGKIASGQSVPWRQAPLSPEPLTASPVAVQAGVAALAATALPENTLVVVESAARAAAAVAAADRARSAASADPGNAQLRAAVQTAAEQANTAILAANAAAKEVAGTAFACMLAGLPATAAGPVETQLPAAALPVAPIMPPVTPGAGGGCSGSKC